MVGDVLVFHPVTLAHQQDLTTPLRQGVNSRPQTGFDLGPIFQIFLRKVVREVLCVRLPFLDERQAPVPDLRKKVWLKVLYLVFPLPKCNKSVLDYIFNCTGILNKMQRINAQLPVVQSEEMIQVSFVHFHICKNRKNLRIRP